MSQAGIISTSSGPVPPIVPTSFVTDINSPAIPIANVLNEVGRSTTANNTNGIRTDGSSGSNTLTIQLTNRISGTATTTDGVTPAAVYNFPLGATPGTYLFSSKVTVFNVTDSLSAAYSSQACVRTNGAAGFLLESGNFFVSEEGAMVALDIGNIVSGNNLQLNVTGLPGKTIDYLALTEYIFVS